MKFKYKFDKNYIGEKEVDEFFLVRNSSHSDTVIVSSDIDECLLGICDCGDCDECNDKVTSPRGVVRRYEVLSRAEVLA